MGDTLQVTFHYQLSILHLKSAWGGPNGGTLTLSSQNLDKLAPVACGPMLLPPQVTLAPYQQWSVSFLCEGDVASTAENDIVVEGVLAETGTDVSVSSRSELTSVKVELMPVLTAPGNLASHRHDFGIGEEVLLLSYPTSSQLSFAIEYGTISTTTYLFKITWDVSVNAHSLKAMFQGVEYEPKIRVLTPTGVEGTDVRYELYGNLVAGQAGGICLVQHFRIHPLGVSFEGIAVEEVPCDELITPDEYFIHLWKYEPYASALQPSHNRRAGAGVWYDVKTGNIMGGSVAWDRAGVGGAFPRMTSDGTPTADSTCGWLGGGSLTWKVPFGWGPKDHQEDASPVQVFAEDSRQVFNLSANGDFSMRKLGHVAERKIDGTVLLYNSPGTGGVGN